MGLLVLYRVAMTTSRFSSRLRVAAAAAALSLMLVSPVSAGVDDVARAAAIVQRLVELNTKFAAYDVELPAPSPIAGASGKYVLPVTGDGALTGWAQKALSAQVGNVVGEQVAGEAAKRTVGAIPVVGGLAGGFAKKKGKEVGALAALGGPEFIKSSSTHSFNDVRSYAVYLHSKMGKSADYSKAVQAAIALYPDLEKTYAESVTAAYNEALKDAQAKKAAADKAAAEAAAKAAKAAEAAKAAAAAAPAPAAPAAP